MPGKDFYCRYYVGHKGKFGHEFLEFEFQADGKVRVPFTGCNDLLQKPHTLGWSWCMSSRMYNFECFDDGRNEPRRSSYFYSISTQPHSSPRVSDDKGTTASCLWVLRPLYWYTKHSQIGET
jgi:hypothetical protein